MRDFQSQNSPPRSSHDVARLSSKFNFRLILNRLLKPCINFTITIMFMHCKQTMLLMWSVLFFCYLHHHWDSCWLHKSLMILDDDSPEFCVQQHNLLFIAEDFRHFLLMSQKWWFVKEPRKEKKNQVTYV